MGKYSRLGKNTLLVFIGNAGSKLVGLLMLPFYTRWLSVEDYGTTDILSVYVSFLLGIVTCCIAEAIFIFPKGQEKPKQRAYFTSGLLFSTIVLLFTGFLFLFSDTIFFFLDKDGCFGKYRWLIYGMLVTSFLQQYTQQFVRSINKMIVYSTVGVVVTFMIALCSFIFIPLWKVDGFVMAMIVSNVIGIIYVFIAAKVYSFFSIRSIQISYIKEMLRYSVPLIPNAIMWWLIAAFNRPLMEGYCGLHDVGIFAVANKFPGIMSMVFNMFFVSWQISVIEEFKEKDFALFFNRVFRVIIVGLTILFLLITVFSRFIVTMFAAPAFYEAYQYIPILMLGSVFSAISALSGSVFSATRESKYFFYSSLWGAAVAVIANLILIPIFQLTGASISVLLSFMAMALSRILYSTKYVKVINIYFYLVLFILMIIAGSSIFICTQAISTTIILLILLFVIAMNVKMFKTGLLMVIAKRNKL